MRDFEAFWRRTVHDGVMANTALPTRTITPAGAIAAFGAAPPAASGIEIAFRTDPTILDGRFNNNGWLQELPKPLTHLTWDNAVLVSPAMMARLGGSARPDFTGGERGQIHGSIVEVRYRGRTVRGTMFPVAGHPDDIGDAAPRLRPHAHRAGRRRARIQRRCAANVGCARVRHAARRSCSPARRFRSRACSITT